MQKPKRARLTLAQINPHYDLQPRMAIDQSVVEEYREAIERGDQMPPVTVFFDRVYYYLVDGFHRLDATKRAGRSEIDAEVIDGDFRAAKLYSLGVNTSHGLKRSSADKRKACLEMLSDAEWAAWADNAIARHLKVDHKTVAKYREESEAAHLGNSQDSDSGGSPIDSDGGTEVRLVARNGTTYEQNTAKIGSSATTIRQRQRGDAYETAAEVAARTDAVAVKPSFRADAVEYSSPKALRTTADNSEVADLRGQLSEARDLIDDLQHTAAELQAEVEGYRASDRGEGEKALVEANKRVLKLEGEIRRLESIRDDWMNKYNEAAKEAKKWRRQAERGHA